MMTYMKEVRNSLSALSQYLHLQLLALDHISFSNTLLTMKVGVFLILHSNFIHQVYFPDAVVGFVMNEYNVSEDAGAVSICIDSGVTEGFQTDLTVTLIANDGTACKKTFLPLNLFEKCPVTSNCR